MKAITSHILHWDQQVNPWQEGKLQRPRAATSFTLRLRRVVNRRHLLHLTKKRTVDCQSPQNDERPRDRRHRLHTLSPLDHCFKLICASQANNTCPRRM